MEENMSQSTRRNIFVLLSLLLVVVSAGIMNARPAVFADDDRDDSARASDDVREAQQTLRDRGYSPGPIDGRLGSRTREALRRYQKDENLPVTGQLDPDTARRVGEARRADESDRMKIQGMDADSNGAITRSEYRGDDQAFANHDWNGDGVLSGEEVRPGAHRPDGHAKGESVSGEFKGAGKEMKDGSGEAAHEMKKGKPVASGKEFGKGAGRFGEKVAKGVKKAVSTESDRGDREKK
jgi:hypothetical protein